MIEKVTILRRDEMPMPLIYLTREIGRASCRERV